MPLNQGLIQVYISPPGEFNFAPLGLALRAAGRELKNLVVRFSAHEMDQGYPVASSHLRPFLVSRLIDTDIHWSKEGGRLSLAKRQCIELIREIKAGTYDLIHLLSIDKALKSEILGLEELLKTCKSRPERLEMILSGSNLPAPIIDIADLVTRMVVKGSIETNDLTSAESDFVEVVTGNGKGKTTYSLGMALLASSLGIPSLFLQFIKSPLQYGETIALNRLPNCKIKTMGKGFLFTKDGAVSEKHRKAALDAWKEFRSEMNSMKYKLIILDEINIAIHYNLLDPTEVIRVIQDRPAGIHLILTGRAAHQDVIRSSDRIIEMREIKHPFRKGIKARKGIEF